MKNHLSSSMSQKRLSGISLLSIENVISRNINILVKSLIFSLRKMHRDIGRLINLSKINAA
nr:unnamed protein product [Callosobruchus chinensis]